MSIRETGLNLGPNTRRTPRPAAQSEAGPSDSVTLGETMPPHNCWDPRTWGKPTIRPDVEAKLDTLANSNCTGIIHTTRGIPHETLHTPRAPQPFAAGRFELTFQDRTTRKETAYIFQTEDGPGHLAQVVPGKTAIPGGFISILDDPKQPFGAETRLSEQEVNRLLDRIYDRFKSPMEDAQAEKLATALDFGYAIQFAGQGEAAVKSAHAQRLA